MFKIPFLSESFIGKFKRNPTDDFADFLNYIFTPILFVICALIISAKQYLGSPIQCLLPANFNPTWNDYSKEYCFTQKTYSPSTNMDDIIYGIRPYDNIHYYPWLALILFKQAIYFYFPCLIIKYFYSRTVDVCDIIEKFDSIRSLPIRKRKKEIAKIVSKLKEEIELESEFNSFSRIVAFLNLTALLKNGFIFIIVKSICLFNVIMQLLFLTLLVGKMNLFWGYDVLISLLYDENNGSIFPRITFCDMKVTSLGNPHNHTFQCLLTINILNEKIFMCIYFYLIFLLFFNMFYIFKVVLSYLLINRQINLSLEGRNPLEIEQFKKVYNSDYRLITYFILNNYGIPLTHEFINQLFVLHQSNV